MGENISLGNDLTKNNSDCHVNSNVSIILSENIHLNSGSRQQDNASKSELVIADDASKNESIIADDVLLDSVNRHVHKIKQFVEMDYLPNLTENEKLCEIAVGGREVSEPSGDLNKNSIMPNPIDENVSQGSSQLSDNDNSHCFKINGGNVLVESEKIVDDSCKLKAIEGEVLILQLSDDKNLLNFKDDEKSGFVNHSDLVNGSISAFESTAENLTGNKVNQKIEHTEGQNAVLVPENKGDNNKSNDEESIFFAKAFNKEIKNMKDLNEISCEIVNSIGNSLQGMNPGVSDNKKDSDTSFCSDGSVKKIPDVKIVINKGALIEKISDTYGKVTPYNMSNDCKVENTAQRFVDDASNRKNEVELSNLEKRLLNSKRNEINARTRESSDIGDHSPIINEDTICGIGSFRPQWLQKYATSECYMLLYSLIGIIQGTYYTFLISCISTLEKRFAFTTKISGAIMVVDEISPLFLGIFVGYFGGKAHRPRLVALGMMLNCISCFSMVLPYAIYGPAQHLDQLGQNKTTKLCDYEVEKEMCGIHDRPPTLAAILILLFANFVKGFGNLAYYAIGLSYLDDNTKKKNTPFYLGIVMALRIFGPTLGFLLSSAFLNINENPFEDPGYGPDDPRWIGGWWIGFLAQGFMLFIVTIPLALFPRSLPNQAQPKSHYTNEQTLKDKFKGLTPALKRLARNPLFVLLLINTIMEILGKFGHYVMLPKYMENQFRLTASEASLYSGPPYLTAYQIAIVVGGFLIYKYRPSAKFITAGLAISAVVLASTFVFLMIPKCPKVDLSNIGLTLDGSLNLQNQCNANCMCTTAAFTPICGPDGRTTYFSPCHAGCTGEEKINDTQIFNNCSCVTDNTGNFITGQSLHKGFCVEEGCWNQALAYIILLPTITGIFSILRVAETMILLRSIAPEDKSVALGTYETFACLFGFIPYPILFGSLVDSACIVWEKSCGESGNCWFYDTDKFNYMLHGVSASFSYLSAFCLFGICYLSYRLPDLYKEDTVDDEEIKDADINNSTATSTTKM